MNSDNNFKADILIIDDTVDNIRFLSTLLSDQGYNVRKALSGEMGIKAARTLPPDLILLDVNMPEMSGYEVCQKLKEDELTRFVPVIFLSALNSIADKVKAFQVGGVDYITKPFQFEEVLARIQTQLTICHLQAQLSSQNQQLQQALESLRKTQIELIQKEKMVGLGQLVAGVAHEINNPISFISGNINPAQRYVESLLKLIHLYQQEYPNPPALIQETIEEIDFEFLTTDLQQLMCSMQSGVERIRNVLLALRLFSRLGESELKRVDIHAGIDSTLLLLQHRLKQAAFPEIQVIKEYGKLPLVMCYANELNQVFFNILNNAIDALQAKVEKAEFQKQSPTIWIRTESLNSNAIRVRIKDNGSGISEAVRSRIFDPFFTTKMVGQGAGLGLSTSYQIVVNKHNGQLTYTSSLEQGTEFSIEIPLS